MKCSNNATETAPKRIFIDSHQVHVALFTNMGKTGEEKENSANKDNMKDWLEEQFNKQNQKIDNLSESLQGEIHISRVEYEEMKTENVELRKDITELNN